MRTFDEYRIGRTRLLDACRELDQLTSDFIRTRSDFENEIGLPDDSDERSPIATLLTEARRRLESSTIEVGIFGNVKRGKSTLVNALVGQTVSSVSVTPATAVPVWIESGPHRSFIVREDGTVEETADARAAADMATQRAARKDSGRNKVIRVVQQLPIEWLPEGLRIVDTPGLDDPEDAALYEELTFAELDRVAAAVFVFCSPPGPSGEEMRLLRALGGRGVDKAFLVCNFFPDHWSSTETRSEMIDYIEDVVSDAGGESIRERPQVIGVSARDGFDAIESDDGEAYERSGVEALRSQLESFLARDALPHLLTGAERRVAVARDILLDAAVQRRDLLEKPDLLAPAKAERMADLERARALVSDIEAETRRVAEQIRIELRPVLAQPFDVALNELESAAKAEDLVRIERQLRVRLETAASKASNALSRSTGIHEERISRQLFEELGVQRRLSESSGNKAATLDWADTTAGLPGVSTGPDWATAAGAGAATAIGGALVGGSLAGGVGIALLAMGPVGWLIGAAAGGAMGLLAGTGGAAMLTKNSISEGSRSELRSALTSQREHSAERLRQTTFEWGDGVVRRFRSEVDQVTAVHRADLERVERLAADPTVRRQALEQANSIIERLGHVL